MIRTSEKKIPSTWPKLPISQDRSPIGDKSGTDFERRADVCASVLPSSLSILGICTQENSSIVLVVNFLFIDLQMGILQESDRVKEFEGFSTTENV